MGEKRVKLLSRPNLVYRDGRVLSAKNGKEIEMVAET